jgi:hypothetical protein
LAHDAEVNAILYPVAANAEEALSRPKGRAARERDAMRFVEGEAVRFVTEPAGPGFATREAALDAYAGRLDDERDGHRFQTLPEDRYLALAERIEGAAPPAPIEPSFRKGRRWPDPPARRPATVFRLMVSYWRIGEVAGVAEPAEAAPPEVLPEDQARALRRRAGAADLEPAQLRALARQPLRPVRPQQPLDVGLFEMPAPEAPHILIPDE